MSTTHSPTMAIVMVSFNTREKTIEAIASALAETIAPHVIVIDNASIDGSADAIAERFPQVDLVRSTENLGFARGVNLGVERATQDYVLLLNPDTVVLDGSLDALVRFAEQNPEYGLYGGRTLREDRTLDPSSCWGAPTIWSLFCFATGLSTAFAKNRFFDPESLGNWQRDTVREVPVVTGCLLLMKRSEYTRIGGMDPVFFLYGEDAEFSIRARRQGLRPVIVPEAVIVHTVGASTKARGAKMSMVMAGKVTVLRTIWEPASERVGVALLTAGVALRMGMELAARRKDRMWTHVWRERSKWLPGYPAAEQALFGRRGA